jgi:hypothetical protein
MCDIKMVRIIFNNYFFWQDTTIDSCDLDLEQAHKPAYFFWLIEVEMIVETNVFLKIDSLSRLA